MTPARWSIFDQWVRFVWEATFLLPTLDTPASEPLPPSPSEEQLAEAVRQRAIFTVAIQLAENSWSGHRHWESIDRLQRIFEGQGLYKVRHELNAVARMLTNVVRATHPAGATKVVDLLVALQHQMERLVQEEAAPEHP